MARAPVGVAVDSVRASVTGASMPLPAAADEATGGPRTDGAATTRRGGWPLPVRPRAVQGVERPRPRGHRPRWRGRHRGGPWPLPVRPRAVQGMGRPPPGETGGTWVYGAATASWPPPAMARAAWRRPLAAAREATGGPRNGTATARGTGRHMGPWSGRCSPRRMRPRAVPGKWRRPAPSAGSPKGLLALRLAACILVPF
jgi:hypothetical protein